MNGYGIFHDHAALRSKLDGARDQLGQVIARLDAVEWPTNADYDLA